MHDSLVGKDYLTRKGLRVEVSWYVYFHAELQRVFGFFHFFLNTKEYSKDLLYTSAEQFQKQWFTHFWANLNKVMYINQEYPFHIVLKSILLKSFVRSREGKNQSDFENFEK